MSRINTNISSLQAMHNLTTNQSDLAVHLQRLSTGLQINSGKDAPAGLIASETLRSEINGINQAIDNSSRAGNVMNTAEGALNEVSALLLQVQSLTNQAANTGALSPDEIQANQLQVDTIINSINRIANTTQFNGEYLLNGALDFNTSGIDTSKIAVTTVNASQVPDGGQVNVAVQVLASARVGTVTFAGSGIGTTPTTIQVAGNIGTQQLSFAASAHNSAVAVAINQIKSSTGVSAAVQANGQLKLYSTAFGSKDFVSIKTLAGSFVNQQAYGADAKVNINGNAASVDGTEASIRSGSLDLTLDLTSAFAQTTAGAGSTTNFYITGGGAKFQIGSQVSQPGQVQMGIQSISGSSLGNATVGYLATIGSGGANSLVSGNTDQAQQILDVAIRQVATLRGRIGAFQKDVLDTNTNSLNVALENVTSSESDIRDADFATETAAMTRAQILVQANTSVLAQANAAPQSVLSLLGH